MRWMKFAAAVGVAWLVGGAWAQNYGGMKNSINNNLQNSVQQHDDALNDALNGNAPETVQPAQAAPVPGALKTGWLTRRREGKEVRLYFAYPAGLDKSKPAAGIIVLQEWWGVNEDMQERTRDFASRGFYAVAPDLYEGKTTDDATQAAKYKDGMTDAAALNDMKAGLDLLGEEERNGVVDAKRVGAVGWCMGGQQGLLLAIDDSRVKATAIFYGPLVTDAEKLKNVQGPVLGIFGNDDKGPSPDDVAKFKAGLLSAGKKDSDVTIYQYDGVGHAFASKSAAKMGAYNADKAKEAFDKMWTWMDVNLPR